MSNELNEGGLESGVKEASVHHLLVALPGCGDGEPGSEPGRRADRLLAERVADRHRIRYVWDAGHWYVWNGTRWFLEPDGARAANSVSDIIASAFDPDCTEERQALVRWRSASQSSAAGIKSLVRLAAARPELRVPASDLDPDPLVLGVANGTLDLRTGTLRAALPADLITRQAAVEFDPDAQCPWWHWTLERLLPDPAMRSFLQRCVGYSLTGRTDDRVVFLVPERSAGGSMVMRTLTALLGDYHQRAPGGLLVSRAKSKHPRGDVARLRGARFVYVPESDPRRLGGAWLEDYMSGAPVSARSLHRGAFSFSPVCKLWMMTSGLSRPQVTGTDASAVPHLVEIPLIHDDFGGAQREVDLRDKLQDELPGILSWALRGCLEWQRRGLDTPTPAVPGHQERRVGRDTLDAFLDGQCVEGAHARVAAQALYVAYRSWCAGNGYTSVSQTSLGRRLGERGFIKGKRGTVSWHGLELAAAASG